MKSNFLIFQVSFEQHFHHNSDLYYGPVEDILESTFRNTIIVDQRF